MTAAATPGNRLEETRHAVARIIDPNCWWDDVPPNDHQQRKCNRALAKADEIIARLAAKPADDPDAMNEQRAAEDAKLAANVREACAKVAAGHNGVSPRDSRDIARAIRATELTAGAKAADEGVREWRCFHCGEVFTDEGAAKEHFGPDTEWQAGCIDPLTKDEAQRRADQVDMYTELDCEREENSRLTSRDYVLSCYERDLAKFFNGAKSVHQAFLVLDGMEDRALAAEEKLAAPSTTGEPKP